MEKYYLYYVAGIACLIELLRYCIVAARERAAAGWHPSPRRSPGRSPLPGRSPVKISPSGGAAAAALEKARSLSKMTPSKGMY